MYIINCASSREFVFNISGTTVSATVTASADDVKEWLSRTLFLHRRHRHRLVVGLGVQWTIGTHSSSYIHFNKPPADTLQLCVGRRCLIFQLAHADYIPAVLRRFLLNPNNTFVGFWNHSDAQKLWISRHVLQMWMEPLDLRKYVAAADGGDLRTAKTERIIREWLGFEDVTISEEISRSNWGSEVLDCDQILQAARDAYCAFLIGRNIRAWSIPRSKSYFGPSDLLKKEGEEYYDDDEEEVVYNDDDNEKEEYDDDDEEVVYDDDDEEVVYDDDDDNEEEDEEIVYDDDDEEVYFEDEEIVYDEEEDEEVYFEDEEVYF